MSQGDPVVSIWFVTFVTDLHVVYVLWPVQGFSMHLSQYRKLSRTNHNVTDYGLLRSSYLCKKM